MNSPTTAPADHPAPTHPRSKGWLTGVLRPAGTPRHRRARGKGPAWATAVSVAPATRSPGRRPARSTASRTACSSRISATKGRPATPVM
jgi:hypothetical protein